MKRLISLLLALTLALSAVPALAANMTLWEQFTKQAVQQSAYRASLTFEVTGGGTEALDPSVWLILSSLAPRLTIEGTNSITVATGVGEATVSVRLGDQTMARTDLRYNRQIMGLSSTLLAGEDIFYTVARDWDLSQLSERLLQGESAWPPTWKMLLEILNAPDEWKTRLYNKLTPYETKLGVWLNGYAAFSSGEIDGVSYTELSCAIPFREMKTEIQQMLVDLYNDPEMLSLLREVVTAQEAAAYLQPAMLGTFIGMLDALDVSGDVEVVRRYSNQGHLLLDMMTMPFPEDSLIPALTITLRPDEFGDVWGVAGQAKNGLEFDATCLAGEGGIYSGSVDLLLPPEENSQATFVVVDGQAPEQEPERRTVSFDYSLSWDAGEDSYSVAAGRYTRNIEGTLLIRPRNTEHLPTQSLSLNCTLSAARLDQTSITQLNGTLTWHDLDSDASITATLSSRTAAPFAISTLDNVVGMRVDLLSGDTLSAVIQSWRDNLSTNFSNLISRLSASVFSFSTPSR